MFFIVQYFRLYLTGILILFTLLFSGAIGFYDYYKGQRQILLNHEKEIELIEETVIQSIHIIDQMYALTDETLGNTMKEAMDVVLGEYERDPVFQNWDFHQLKEQIGMDVYIINDENSVIFSSFEEDIGLNFEECCGSFVNVIEQRRLGKEFTHEGMDIQQASGEVKKFAYMPSPDQKYLFELSMSLENGEVFEIFNILEKMNELKEEYKLIQSIRMYNSIGLSFGDSGSDREVSEETRHIFEEAKRTNEKVELTRNVNGKNVTYRYIPYVVPYEDDYPMKRVVEIVYNEVELEGVLKFYREGFIYQQLIIVFVVILFAVIIGKIISKPIHLAFHDSLTGLKNRAAFEVEGNKRMRQNDKHLSLMMIDVDNFKQVNDRLGHLAGDQLLIDIATTIEQSIQSKGIAARLGGDEFVVICSGQKKEEIVRQAELLIENVNEVFKDLNTQHEFHISISVGIAYAKKTDVLKDLYDRADQALYQAKRHGKNQCAFFESDNEMT